MLDQLKQMFKTPTADELANREYDEARRELLVSQSAAEYHQSMIDYHIKRLLRLKEIIDASPENDK
jgi:hypothetical protein